MKESKAVAERKMRVKITAEKNPSVAESVSLTNLESESGELKVQEESKSKEESNLSNSGNNNDTLNTTQDTPKSSKETGNHGIEANKKPRSNRKPKSSKIEKETVDVTASSITPPLPSPEKKPTSNRGRKPKDDSQKTIKKHTKDSSSKEKKSVTPKKIEKTKKVDNNEKVAEVPTVQSNTPDITESSGPALLENSTLINTPPPVEPKEPVEATVNITKQPLVSKDTIKVVSPVENESNESKYELGDLYWGRIHNFTYWPCIVCPDTLSEGEDNPTTRLVNQQKEVHVRFFADNARHSWVKQENMIPYVGLEIYREHIRKVKDEFGEKSSKYQAYLPKRQRLKVWLQAVKEADIVANLPYSERLEKFFKLNEETRERNKEERMRRKSISFCKSSPEATLNRLDSPTSPAFSPLRTMKRRKTHTADAIELIKTKRVETPKPESPILKLSDTKMQTEYNTSLESQSTDKSEFLDSPEFKQFHDVMKDFVMHGLQSDFIELNLFIAVKNIWALKSILHKHFAANQISKFQNLDEKKSLKRLSSRLKDIQRSESKAPRNRSNSVAMMKKKD